MNKWKRLKSNIIYSDKFFTVRQDLVKLPDGSKKEWTYWDSTDSVMVIGRTKENKLVMIRQYRYLVGNDVIEFPSGALMKNEKIVDGAKREFEEETGYVAKNLKKLGAFYETYGQLNRKIHLFYCDNIKKTEQKLDKGKKGYEDIKVELIDFDKALKMALENKIVAMGSTLAVLLFDKIINA